MFHSCVFIIILNVIEAKHINKYFITNQSDITNKFETKEELKKCSSSCCCCCIKWRQSYREPQKGNIEVQSISIASSLWKKGLNEIYITMARRTHDTIQQKLWKKMEKQSPGRVMLSSRLALTVNKWGEEHAEPAESAFLISPHSHNSHTIIQHHVIGHGATELGLEVLNGTAAIIHGHKVLLALIRVFHLVLQEAQVDLQIHRKCKSISKARLSFTLWRLIISNCPFYVGKYMKMY